ncbi:dockerin type I domain-containing protein [Ruminococcus sp.]|uniref:dockerin type I domain-containing protein n=1 Tax=Ruminococcus sp. TaxID=41978 RepID=UPI0025FD8135|nr:dockerin type I domain-containing protein [Ruminococcus sp.]MCR4638915.1 hypothetical protein [Ruminococcus sp.]
MKKTKLWGLFASAAAAAVLALAAVPLSASAAWKQIDSMGDLNGDKQVNVADMVTLCKHLHGAQPLGDSSVCTLGSGKYAIKTGPEKVVTVSGGISVQKADLNRDGIVDIFDLVEMRKQLISADKYGEIFLWHDETTTTTTAKLTTATSTTTATTTTTTVPTKKDFIPAPVYDMYGTLPSQGKANLIVFYVDFPDCKFKYEPTTEKIEEIAFGPENESSPLYPYESCSAFYSRASKGAMKLQGKAYRYTCKNNISSYEGDIFKADFTTEVLKNMDSTVDYSQFDANHDGIVDAMLFCVPSSSDEQEWWPCAGEFGGDYWLKLDGMTMGHVITGNADITSDTDYSNFTSTYLHEMGHCMGLPDYYLYVDNGEDFEGLHGSAGYDLMDEAHSDFSAISKLMLGWYREDQIQVYDSSKGTQTFTLTNGQSDEGNCLIIPRGTLNSEYKSEYFILEYTTLDQNNSDVKKNFWWRPIGSGVRILHVEATEYNDGWRRVFKYESGNDEFTNKDKGRRFVRLVDDGEKDNLRRTGDVVKSSISGFCWYDSGGAESFDPGVIITIGEKNGDSYTVTVSRK